MPVKSIRSKQTRERNVSSPVSEEIDEVIPAVPLKSKTPFEIEENDPVINLEEKPVDDILNPDEETEELELEEAVLDEEIDPFHDKWEA